MDKSEVIPLFMIIIFISFYATLLTGIVSIIPVNYGDGSYPIISEYQPNFNDTYYEIDYATKSYYEGLKYYQVNASDVYDGEDYHETKFSIPSFYDVNIYIDFDEDSNWYLKIKKRKEGSWLSNDVHTERYTKEELLEKVGVTDLNLNIGFQCDRSFTITFIPLIGNIYDGIFLESYYFVLHEPTANIETSQDTGLDALLQLLTFSMPDIPVMINFLVATPIYVMLVYITIRILTWFLPLVSGGA